MLPYPTIDTTELFEKYFSGLPPFSNREAKKYAFPDEMAMITLSQWCEANKKECLIFSTDKDLQRLSKPGIILVKDYEKKVSELSANFLQQDRINLLSTLYTQNKTHIQSEVTKWLKGSLDDTSLYSDAANSYDVHDITIHDVIVDIKDYQIIHTDDKIIEVEIKTIAKIHVEIEIDDETTMYKDYDDKSWRFADTTPLDIKREIDIPVKAVFSITDKKDYNLEPEIIEYNNNNELEIQGEIEYDY